ncbi:MAG: LPS export ABC transporter periplasmic protein LptC [Gammaproteobacteria bacterium]
MTPSRISTGNLIAIVALFMLVCYTGWLLKATSGSSLVAPEDKKHPDFFVTDVTAIETSDTGSIKNQFMSPKVVHYEENDTYFYDTPHVITYSSDGKAPWNITALHGKSINGNERIILWNDVKIHEPPSTLNNDTWITTSWMVVYPKQNYAESDKPVTFTEPDLTVHSIGMRVYFKEKKVELLNQAQGVYDETKDKKPE